VTKWEYQDFGLYDVDNGIKIFCQAFYVGPFSVHCLIRDIERDSWEEVAEITTAMFHGKPRNIVSGIPTHRTVIPVRED